MRSATRIRQQILASLGGGLALAAGVACGGAVVPNDADAGPAGTGGTGGASNTAGAGATGGSGAVAGSGGSGASTTGAGGAGTSGAGGDPTGTGGSSGGTGGEGGATGGSSGTGGTTTGTGGATSGSGGQGGATAGSSGAGGTTGGNGATGGTAGTTTGMGGASGAATTGAGGATGGTGGTTGGAGGASGGTGGTGPIDTGCSVDAGSADPECRADGSTCFSAAALTRYLRPDLDSGTPRCTLPSRCPQAYELLPLSYCGQPIGSVWPPGDAPPNGQCCYPKLPPPVDGRPFMVEGEARQASAVERADWLDAKVDERGGAARPGGTARGPLHAEQRAKLATVWLADARAEHASIATFARLTLQLLSLGAPPELLAAAQRAAQDEIEHARLCFGLASRYAGRSLGPGPLAMTRAVAEVTLVELAVAAVHEGCIGETTAAVFASERLEQARDPDVRAALVKIAQDETRHAELAWRTVVWAIECGGATVVQAIRTAFDQAVAALASKELVLMDEDSDTDLAAHGHASQISARRVQQIVMREIVVPIAAKLLRGATREPTRSAASAGAVIPTPT